MTALYSELWSKPGRLGRVLELILRRQMRRLVLTYKDCLLRFGADLVFTLCELQGIELDFQPCCG